MTWGKDWAGRQLRWLWELFHWVATSAFLDQYRKGMILPARKKHRKAKKDVSFGNITILTIPIRLLRNCDFWWFLGCPPRLYKKKWFWNILNIYKSLACTVHHSAQCLMICAGSRRPTRPSISFRTVEVRTLEVSSMKTGLVEGKIWYNRKVYGFPTWNISRFPMVSCFFSTIPMMGYWWESSLIHSWSSLEFHGVPGRHVGPCPARCESGSRAWSVHPCGQGPHSGTICWWLGDADFHLISVEIKAASSRMLR